MRLKSKKILLLPVFLLAVSFTLAQIPSGYYDAAEGLSGDELKTALHSIIRNNHSPVTYDALRDYVLPYTDEDPNNTNNVILLYTGWSSPVGNFGGNPDNWNREHVWAKSHGDFGNNPPAGTDAHHVRPADVSVNSSRGNKDFDNGGSPHPEAVLCKTDFDSWEPRDEVKGDVARMMFYMMVRYKGENGEPDLELVNYTGTASSSGNGVHGKLSTLIQWHYQDLPDNFEIRRNNRIYEYQYNRNPFIDHPEFVNLMFDTNVGMQENKLLPYFIYPNPVKDILIIENLDLQDGFKLQLYDLSGREYSPSCQRENTKIFVHTKDLPCGTYILRISNAGRQIHRKILKACK